MVDRQRSCPDCGTPVAEELLICPRCHALLETARETDETTPAPPLPAAPVPSERPAPSPPAPANPFAVELGRRLARIGQWAESAEALGVDLPRLPAWAEEAARTAPNPEPWAEVVRGIERLAQRRIVTAFEEWERRAKGRLGRLEAYAVDSRLEREQIDDALHAARVGDVAHALATFQQVDRVVALKERHLDQAREDLERIVSLLKDLQALGLPIPQDPAVVAKNLEAELRAGRLAPLKQQIRALRLQTVLNGKVVQDASTGDMIFDVPALIEFLSQSTTLLPGTVVMTGTPAGVGVGRKPPLWLKPGDEVSVTIEGIGTLTNPVRDEI
jgi:hypothetical protein